MIKWGDEIEVNGQCPAWLRARDIVDLKTAAGWRRSHETTPAATPPHKWNWRHDDGEVCITHIRLPADHWAYKMLAMGLWLWASGRQTPADWTLGDQVLLRSGATVTNRTSLRWVHWQNPTDIIGYKRTEPAATSLTSTVEQADLYWRFSAAHEAATRSTASLEDEIKALRGKLALIAATAANLDTDSATGRSA